MVRSFRYRLRPTRRQAVVLCRWLDLTREIYNSALEERKGAWAKQRVRVSAFDQIRALPSVREVRPEFNAVPINVLRGAIRRLDRAFAAFFRRCRLGATPGYPRFRGQGRFQSILIDDLGKKSPIVAGGKRVAVPLLGKIKFKQHRPVEGTPKAMRLTLRAGRWYVTFACVDVSAKPLPATGHEVGVDLGLTNFIATSDGDMIPNERPGTRAAQCLARAQRRVSRRKKGGGRRREAVRLLARAHGHVANIRRERHITIARALITRYDTIYVENLNIRGLARGMLARSVHDAAWRNFLNWLSCKAEDAGRTIKKVDPRGTSQTCPDCGRVAPKSLSERTHRCDCGLVCDRDIAAARVILRLGQSQRGAALPVSERLRSAKPESSVINWSTP